jgi:hypothetical protein
MTLIYLCPAIQKAIARVKVICRQAEWIFLTGKSLGFFTAVMQPNTRFFRDRCLDSQVPLKRAFFKCRWTGKPSFSMCRGVLDAQRRTVVMPELWAPKHPALGRHFLTSVQAQQHA